jgi:hypothetical protein
MEAAYVMHELGHSMGIEPWTTEGCDNYSFSGGRQNKLNYDDIWGNYYSVMNYYHITDKNLVDYSDGTNGKNDFDDWSHLYLPTFQLESRVFEGIDFSLPYKDKLNGEILEHAVKGWEYDENISEDFTNEGIGWTPYKSDDIKWVAYVKTDDATQPSNRTIRLYAYPELNPVDTGWTLSYEINMNSDGEFLIYSLEEKTQEVLDEISQSD